MLLRHLLSILLLPAFVVVIVPWAVLGSSAAAGERIGISLPVGLRRAAAVVLFVVGFAFFSWCVGLFARIGRGTLAPWDPTRKLVVVGPYRHLRNPMISGVALMLVGEALFWDSRTLCLWAAGFLGINHFYFVLSEEPGLERRFGEAYRKYKANVPRWVPRWRPWTSG